MTPPAVPRPPGWASARLARRVSIWAVPRPPGWAVSRAACRFTGWCARSCATRRCTSITAAGRRRSGPTGRPGRRATAVRHRAAGDACDGIARPASAPFPPRLLTHPM